MVASVHNHRTEVAVDSTVQQELNEMLVHHVAQILDSPDTLVMGPTPLPTPSLLYSYDLPQKTETQTGFREHPGPFSVPIQKGVQWAEALTRKDPKSKGHQGHLFTLSDRGAA